MLIENGANPNISGTNKVSPLIITITAPSESRYDIVYYLINNGANVFQTDFSGRTLLNELIINNNVLDSDEKKEKKEIETELKARGERNKQKRKGYTHSQFVFENAINAKFYNAYD